MCYIGYLHVAISTALYYCCILNGGIAHNTGLLHLHIVLLSLFLNPHTVWYYLWNTHLSLGRPVSEQQGFLPIEKKTIFCLMTDIVIIR